MKHSLLVLSIFLLHCIDALGAAPPARSDLWQQVQEAEAKGRPKTAVGLLEKIVTSAREDGEFPEAIKALAKKISAEGQIQGGHAEEQIVRLEQVIEDWPKEAQPILETVLAHWYWGYFQQNQWRFLQRTRTGESPGDDIQSWDLPRILAEIDRHFTAALEAGAVLKNIPIADWGDLLQKGSLPDSYRPTLYDFVAFEALRFYRSGEQAGSRAVEAFGLSAESPVFDPLETFLAWKIETPDGESPTAKGLRLYQGVLEFHRHDDNPDARVDADLGRLEFGFLKATGEDKNKRYQAALERFIAEHAGHRVSARAQAKLADLLRSEGKLKEAHRVAGKGAAAFPGSPGSNRCANLLAQIEQPSLGISVERVWNPPLPEISVDYRNLTKVHFRIYRYSWEEMRKKDLWNPDYLNNQKEIDLLLENHPLREWSADLPATDDFQGRSKQVIVPDDLEPGFHFLVSSHRRDFRERDKNQVAIAGFWVSRLALIVRTSPSSGKAGGFVLDALSGEPIEGAKIKAWTKQGDKTVSMGVVAGTDADGLFQFPANPRSRYVLLAEHQGQAVSTFNPMGTGRLATQRPHEQTYFFTDRSLYRPGQTIHYKGISIYYDQKKNDYRTIAKRNVRVVFKDVNGKEIATQNKTSNDFGSFSGSFTAPRDRLMGRMSLQSANPVGSTPVTVEEYKRPKFKVEIPPPTEPAKLGGKVTIRGKATAYTGAAVDHAKVSYRVVRKVQYPVWWGWCFWWRQPQTESQEIAHGTATTKADGSFEIPFTATPDPEVLERDEPIFQFTIFADVTNSAGETRSDQRTVNLGFTALKAAISAGPWQEKGKAVVISVTTSSLDGEPRAAQGVVRIYPLVQPENVQRARLRPNHHRWPHQAEPEPDPANPDSWENGPLLVEIPFSTGENGKTELTTPLGDGAYRAILESRDAFGKRIQAQLPLQVFDRQAKRFATKIPFQVAAPKWELQPGDSFTGLWGSGYDEARAFVEIYHRGKALRRYWTAPGQTQALIEQEIGEQHRGGLQVFVTMLRKNRAYTEHRQVRVPWSNKNLTIQWQRHRSKLEPGSEETWSALVSGPGAENKAAAMMEMVATLYDESLDAYLPHHWRQSFGIFYQDRYPLSIQFQNRVNPARRVYGDWQLSFRDASISYRQFPPEIQQALQVGRMRNNSFGTGAGSAMAPLAERAVPTAASMVAKGTLALAKDAGGFDDAAAAPFGDSPSESVPQVNLDQVSARTNLNETAFFLPHLTTQKDGSVKLEFTMPEALTSWRFFAFAHDRELRSGFLSDSIVTAKDLMVQPNPPRFLREGDTLEFTVKVSNQSDSAQQGRIRLTLADAQTLDPADDALGNSQPELPFDIPAKESRSFSWELKVPDGQGFLTYKSVASTGKLSDGEEGFLPVLPRRILLTESLSLPIRGKGEKTFKFEKLLNSAKSKTIQNQSLTVQMTSNPGWHAVMALPYLMEFPHECSEQVFNRYYANALGGHITNSDPKIERIFKQWRGTGTLDSPLEKNQNLKQVMLEETPWLRQSNKEGEARRNIGLLFEQNKLDSEQKQAFRKLAQQQRDNGLWPWFPGGRGDEFMTLYITTGFGRLRHLGVDSVDTTLAVRSLAQLDQWMDKLYRDILKSGHPDENHLSPLICYYLYGRSFFLGDRKIAAEHQEALAYFQKQAKVHWLELANRQNQAHLAIALQRFGVHAETSKDIMVSLKERSISDEELGMFWRDTEFSYWWYRAPIETQALMIEAFDEVAKDKTAVENLKVWLLKQKQTQDWKTTKGTADAVYALLLRGTDLLASDEPVEVSLAGKTLAPGKVEAGTGFYERRFGKNEIEPEQGEIKVTKMDDGVAWGSLHWQYFESMENITPHEGTPLSLKKTLWVKENGDKGPVLRTVKPGSALKVGDQLLVRIELRSDRDMEYLHLKDQRGSGTEPLNVLSRYQYQDGLAYYESTRDTASHFFIDYLPKGTYVFEYSLRVFHKGKYQSGMANIQCMYAPEFNSHSQSFGLKVH